MTEQEIVDSWNKYSNYKFYNIDDIDAIIGKRTPTEMGEWIDFSNFRWTDRWIYLNENNQFVSTDKPSSIIDMEEYKDVISTSNMDDIARYYTLHDDIERPKGQI